MNFTTNSLEHIKKLIVENQIEKAMEILNRSNDKSIWFQNARAVCLMRLDFTEDALKILTPIVYPKGTVVADVEISDKIKLNLAEAMFLVGNVAGAKSLLNDVKEESKHKSKLIETFKKWKKSLPFWGRVGVYLGALPYNRPVSIEYPFGEP
ncbi:MAG: hypothetical protein PHF37_00565 [Phycisphaerae bacterium]|nr:hypothetical protein [Phycisphaerae bacterium]